MYLVRKVLLYEPRRKDHTYSMEQSPSWEANRFSGSQEIPHFLWNPKVHYHIHKCSPPVVVVNHLNPVHNPTSWGSILILSSHLCLDFPSGLYPQVSPPKPCICLSSPPYVLHGPPISLEEKIINFWSYDVSVCSLEQNQIMKGAVFWDVTL
jgi:hypothetical protein